MPLAPQSLTLRTRALQVCSCGHWRSEPKHSTKLMTSSPKFLIMGKILIPGLLAAPASLEWVGGAALGSARPLSLLPVCMWLSIWCLDSSVASWPKREKPCSRSVLVALGFTPALTPDFTLSVSQSP